MMLRCFIVLLSFIVACSQPVQQTPETIVTPEASSKVYKQTIKHRPFSDPATEDTFIVTLQGDSVQTADVTFEIHNNRGEVIYQEQFDAIDLINYDLPENASRADFDKFILNRIDTFFDEDNFKSPAIHSDMELDSEYSDAVAWEDIKSNEQSIGFYYLLGEEDGRWIAYSKRRQKVVLYFNCC